MLFAGIELLPGGHEVFDAGLDLSPAEVARIEQIRGRDQPILSRFHCWWVGPETSGCEWWPAGRGLLNGDLGFSRHFGRPISELLGERFPRTLWLMIPALGLALLVAVALGTVAAYAPGSRWDRVLAGLSYFGHGVPAHWWALILIICFSLQLGWLPSSGLEDVDGGGWLRHAVLPIAVLTTVFVSRWLRLVRAAVLEARTSPFARALLARGVDGVPHKVRVLRAALPTILVVVGHALPALISGSVVVERAFVYPGMGSLLFDGVAHRDPFIVATGTLTYVVMGLLAALFVDLVVVVLDPRARDRDVGEGLG